MRMTGEETFAGWLQRQLEERDWGLRTLARHINPDNPELPRRALIRYVHHSAVPSERYASAIADALGITREQVPVKVLA